MPSKILTIVMMIGLVGATALTATSAEELDPRNVVPNGSFEELDAKGAPAGWRFSQGPEPGKNAELPKGMSWAIDKNVKHEGNQSLRMSGAGVTESHASFHPTDVIHLKAPRFYELSLWAKAENVEFSDFHESTIGFIFMFAASVGGETAPPLILQVDSGTYDWKRFTVLYKTTLPTALTPRTWRAVWKGSYWIDDITLREVIPDIQETGKPAHPSVPVGELVDHYEDALRSEAGKFAVLFAPPTKKILRRMLPDKQVFSGGASTSISLAGNEHEGIQIVVAPLWDKDVTGKVEVWVSPLCNSQTGDLAAGARVSWHPVGYFGAQKDDEIIGETWPDVLLPAGAEDQGFSVRGDELQPVWVDVYAGEDTPAGDYETTVTVKAGSPPQTLAARINVHVYNFSIPQRHAMPMSVGARTPASRALLSEYRLENRQLMMPGPPFDLWGVMKEHEFREFAEVKPMIAEELEKYRAGGGKLFKIPVPHFRGDKGTMHPVGGVWNHDVIFDEPDAAYIVRYHRQFAKWLREKGLLQDAYVLLWDEPAPSRFPQIHTLRELIRKADPGIRCLVHAGLHRELMDDVDIWSSGMWQWDKKRELAAEIAERGIDQWWYNVPPLGADPAIDLLWTRLFFWSTWKYQIDGALLWTVDAYWYFSKLGTMSQVENTTDCRWSKGQTEDIGGGSLTYPLPGIGEYAFKQHGWKALPSIRLEAVRDGLEDYEYFALLRKLIEKAKADGEQDADAIAAAEKLLDVPTEIESDDFHPEKLTQYTRDGSLVRRHRDRLARMIELLSER